MAAKGENDKPLHTNDRARDIAAFFALRADSSYCQNRATERILEHRKATLAAEIERLRREHRIALIDYERQQLGRRDAAQGVGRGYGPGHNSKLLPCALVQATACQ